MWSTVEKALRPPIFEDTEKSQRAAIIWFTGVLGLGVAMAQAVTYLMVPTMASSAPWLVLEVGGLIALLVAVRRGHVVAPAVAFVSLLVALVTAFVFFGGGLQNAFPPLLGTAAIMGALMLGWRTGAALTVWAAGCTVAVYVTGSSEIMLVPGQDRAAMLVTIQLLTVLLGGSLVSYFVFRLAEALRTERDLTQRAERSATTLEAARRYTADVVQSMAECVLIVRQDGTVHDINDAGVRLFGAATAAQLVGQPLDRLLPAEDLANLAASATPGTRAFGETTLQSGPRERTVRIARSPVIGEDGSDLWVFVLSDVTQQAEAKQRSEDAAQAAQEASRAKSQFLANMSHELRTPLNGVIGYADILIEEVQDTQVLADVSRIQQAGKHLLSLINDVLDMSKIEAGHLEVAWEPVFPREVLDEVRDVVMPMAERRGNSVDLEVDSDVLVIQTDSRKFRQILLNLTSNAVKFTENGQVRIRISHQHGQLRVDVRDTGIGIRGDTIARLFQPFVQADDSTSRQYGGTGLGLALSRRFAEMLGGQISVQSELGKGSTFTLLHPIGQTVTHTPAAEIDMGRAPLVLCVDDDPDTLDLLGRVLRRQGLRVAQASNAAQALEIAREHIPAVITLDVMMPEMDGWTLLRRIRAEPALQDIPVVMLSMVDHRQASARALGASDYLVKPVQPNVLVPTLRRYLSAGSGSVLVVDDEEDMRDILRRLLAGEGWTVSVAPNSRVALDLLPEVRPDLVLLDLMMPEMDGFAFIETVREDERFLDLPIVVLTAMELDQQQWEMLTANTSQVVPKAGHGLQRVLQVVRRFAGVAR